MCPSGIQPNTNVKWIGNGNICTSQSPLTHSTPPPQSLAGSKLWKGHMRWYGTPLLSGLHKMQVIEHANFPGMVDSCDRWCCFDFHFKLKKKFFFNYPLEPVGLGPLLSAAREAHYDILAGNLQSWWQTHLQGWSGQSHVTVLLWHVRKPGGEAFALSEAD
jgi:hypothetical protein